MAQIPWVNTKWVIVLLEKSNWQFITTFQTISVQKTFPHLNGPQGNYFHDQNKETDYLIILDLDLSSLHIKLKYRKGEFHNNAIKEQMSDMCSC